MALEVQEDKVLVWLLFCLSILLGVSYIASMAIMLVIVAYSLYKGYNLKFKSIYILFLLNILVCVCYKNYLGIATNIALIVFFYLSDISNLLNFSVIVKYSAIMGLIEIIFSLLLNHRAGIYSFFNPNYYGAYLALLILAYSFKKYDRKYLVVFIIALILTGSRFAVIALVITYTLSIFFKNRTLGISSIVIALIYFYLVYKGILPFVRSDTISTYLDLRLWIYQLGIKAIKTGIYFGHGPTYFYEYSKHVYPHTHNILIEFILSFGILGLIYVIYVLRHIRLNKKRLLLLVLVLIHGLADYTIFWPQTALLFLMLFNSEGKKDVSSCSSKIK